MLGAWAGNGAMERTEVPARRESSQQPLLPSSNATAPAPDPTRLQDVAHRRLVPGDAKKRVVEALVEEQARLLPLPAHDHEHSPSKGVPFWSDIVP
jgi:hypothetical protein